VFKTKASKFERNYSSEEEYRWFSTQIITSNVSRAELSAALQRIALATNLASDGLASVYCHGLVVKCQALEVVRLLPSVATGEDFVDSSAGIKIPWAGSNKLILSLMSPPVPPTTSKCVQHSDGLKLLPGTSPSLYLNGAPRTFIAERPHVFVITDPRLHTITDLLDEQLGSEPSMKARTAKLKQLKIMLEGLQVRARLSTISNEFATKVVDVVCDDDSQSALFRSRPDLPLINVGSSRTPVFLIRAFASWYPIKTCVVEECLLLRD
jgi:hypothetical protein